MAGGSRFPAGSFRPRRVVWAKVEGHEWWPARVVRRRAVPREVGPPPGGPAEVRAPSPSLGSIRVVLELSAWGCTEAPVQTARFVARRQWSEAYPPGPSLRQQTAGMLCNWVDQRATLKMYLRFTVLTRGGGQG